MYKMEDGFLPAYYDSIFYQLFQYASDMDCKLILLDQILEIGDQREIALLEELENTESLKVSARAYEVKCFLLERIQKEEEEAERLPMSLCFLYEEFDIYPPKSELDLDIDFELSLEMLAKEQ